MNFTVHRIPADRDLLDDAARDLGYHGLEDLEDERDVLTPGMRAIADAFNAEYDRMVLGL